MTAPAKAIRSPSYPNMALRDAIEAVGKIEKNYRSSPVDRVDAVKLIGFKALSGPSNKALAALASYGLLERAGKGEARVTERARDILHADSDQQRTARVYEAAMEPQLFRELRERFPDVFVPPMEGVVTYLNRQGFNPNAVRPAAKAFLETMSYLEEIGASDSHGFALPAQAEMPPIISAQGTSMPEYQFAQPKTASPFRVVMNGTRLDIQASVDSLDGLKKLQTMLAKYEDILRLLDTPISSIKKPEGGGSDGG